MPVPRNAEPIVTIANCSASAGRYQRKYDAPAALVAPSAATAFMYNPENA